jgi:pimeloyl-ACP methyl ester carboxylesterase
MKALSVSSRPPLWREARIGLEAAALLRDPVLRGAGLRDGRGRPALLIPGFMAGDGSLAPMADWLRRAGYRPSKAGMLSNVGCAGGGHTRLEQRLERLVAEQGQRAVVIGQSRGGSMAKVLAVRRPDLVCGLVTLGSPHQDPLAVHPVVRASVEAVSRLGSLGFPGCSSAVAWTATAARRSGRTWRRRRRRASGSSPSTRAATASSTGAPASTRRPTSRWRSRRATAGWLSAQPRGGLWPTRWSASGGRRGAAPSRRSHASSRCAGCDGWPSAFPESSC